MTSSQLERAYLFAAAISIACGSRTSFDPVAPIDIVNLGSVEPDAGGPQPDRRCIIDYAVGDWHSCAVLADHSLFCWGEDLADSLQNHSYLTGQGSPVPFEMTSLRGHVVQVAIGSSHACVLQDDGSVWCWGNNTSKQVTAGQDFVAEPVHVDGLPLRAQRIVAGGAISCALLDDGTLWCWGIGPGVDATSGPHRVIAVGNDATDLSSRAANTCVVRDDSLWCWGGDNWGALGVGTADGPWTPETLPIEVASLHGRVDRVVVGYDEICSLLRSGSVVCSGRSRVYVPNAGGPIPKPVPGLGDDIAQIALGDHMGCALDSQQTGWCWGDPRTVYPDLPDLRSPTADPVFTGARRIALGATFACAESEAGRLLCWGFNNTGQLGNGRTALWEPLSPDTLPVLLPCP
jgi:alpha-tubulin suppressor-like RCC1 family protein